MFSKNKSGNSILNEILVTSLVLILAKKWIVSSGFARILQN